MTPLEPTPFTLSDATELTENHRKLLKALKTVLRKMLVFSTLGYE